MVPFLTYAQKAAPLVFEVFIDNFPNLLSELSVTVTLALALSIISSRLLVPEISCPFKSRVQVLAPSYVTLEAPNATSCNSLIVGLVFVLAAVNAAVMLA